MECRLVLSCRVRGKIDAPMHVLLGMVSYFIYAIFDAAAMMWRVY